MKRLRESDGSELARPPAGDGSAWVPVDRGGRQVAAMVIDETLAEDPELVRAAASTTLLAVENGDLEGKLRASRARILEAGHAERLRIERDLHDGAQQRPVSLRIDLTLAGERLDRSEERAMLERLGGQVDDAIEELRGVAHGVYPSVLADRGVGMALRAVARSSAIAIRVGDEWRGRHSEAGRDDGLLLLPRVPPECGQARRNGLTNFADRVAAVGGTLTIDSARSWSFSG